MDFIITTHEKFRFDRSTPVSTAPVKVRFSFLIGHDVFLAVTAEVTEERDGDGTVGHDVTILECVQEGGHFEVPVYEPGMECLRESLEQAAVEAYNNPKNHAK
jgi:hypothetical protein